MKKRQYAFSFDGEDYNNGLYDSIEDILKELKYLQTEESEVWIGQAVEPELRWETNEDQIVDSIMENLYDDCGEFADSFGITTDVEIDLKKMIDNTVRKWINKHNLKPNCFTIINESLYSIM